MVLGLRGQYEQEEGMCSNKKHTSSHVCGRPSSAVQVAAEYRDRLLSEVWEVATPSHKTQSVLQRNVSWGGLHCPGFLWGNPSTQEDQLKEPRHSQGTNPRHNLNSFPVLKNTDEPQNEENKNTVIFHGKRHKEEIKCKKENSVQRNKICIQLKLDILH